jgi:hypothetical protein
MEMTMRRTAPMMIRASLAIVTVAAGLVVASSSPRAQAYLVNGRPASAVEVRYLSSHGMPPGNWRIDGWGIGPADGYLKQAASAADSAPKCWYVLDVPLGDCGTAGAVIAARSPEPSALPQSVQTVRLAAAATPAR